MPGTANLAAGFPAWLGVSFVVWIAVGVAGFFLFFVSKNVAFKRRYFPWYVILAEFCFYLCFSRRHPPWDSSPSRLRLSP